jgi:hypothetical protein
MAKLQETIRPNGYVTHSIVLPSSEVERAGLSKGDYLEVKCSEQGVLILKRRL